jgi:hypothetical protein
MVTENRALWIEPGYLVLIRWTRSPGDNAVIAALEGSTDALASYLTEHIQSNNDLHELTQLHTHENALQELLAERIRPAVLEVLHLDHDCSQVCSIVTPSHPPDAIPIAAGGMSPLGWE